MLEEEEEVERFVRLDVDIEGDGVTLPSTPGGAPGTSDPVSPNLYASCRVVDNLVAQLIWNAVMSPRLRMTKTTPQHGTDGFSSNDPVGVARPIIAKELILECDDELQTLHVSGTAATTTQRKGPFPFPRIPRELTASPSDAYLQRKEAGAERQRASSMTSTQRSISEGSSDEYSSVEDSRD